MQLVVFYLLKYFIVFEYKFGFDFDEEYIIIVDWYLYYFTTELNLFKNDIR